MTARVDQVLLDGAPRWPRVILSVPRQNGRSTLEADLERLYGPGITLRRRFESGEPPPYWARPEYRDPLWAVREVAARHLSGPGR